MPFSVPVDFFEFEEKRILWRINVQNTPNTEIHSVVENI